MVGTESPGADWLDIPGTVLLSERLGRHVELDVEAGSDQLIAVSGSDHAPHEGDAVTLQIHLPNVHIFAAADTADADSARIGSATGDRPKTQPQEAR